MTLIGIMVEIEMMAKRICQADPLMIEQVTIERDKEQIVLAFMEAACRNRIKELDKKIDYEKKI
jgi:hypothetical protein